MACMDAVTAPGLSAAAALEAARRFGSNTLPDAAEGWARRALRPIVSPITGMLVLAAALSWWTGKRADAWIILALLALNIGIGVWHEWKADDSIRKLRERLTFSVHAKRDGAWVWVPSTALVPGDVIELRIGAVVPADATIILAENLSINESVLTGESLPKEKSRGDAAYSGSFVATGEGAAQVMAIGTATAFGKTVSLVERTKRRSALEKDIVLFLKPGCSSYVS